MKRKALKFDELESLELLSKDDLSIIKGGYAQIEWGIGPGGEVLYRLDGGDWTMWSNLSVTIRPPSYNSDSPNYTFVDNTRNGGGNGSGGSGSSGGSGGGSGGGDSSGGSTGSGGSIPHHHPSPLSTGIHINYLNMFLGLGEAAFGVYSAIQTGGLSSAASYYMIADGLSRMGLALNSNGPSNIGGVVGSFYGPNGQKWGELINDGTTAVISGGAFTSVWEAWGSITAGDYALGSYFIAEGGSTVYNVADILNNYFMDWYE